LTAVLESLPEKGKAASSLSQTLCREAKDASMMEAAEQIGAQFNPEIPENGLDGRVVKPSSF